MKDFTKEEASLLEEKNRTFNQPDEKIYNPNEDIVFGIICLEDDDSMTSIVANSFRIPIKSKKDIYDKFTKLCRVPVTYVEYLWSMGIYFIPIFY